jgi:hypothetical protein
MHNQGSDTARVYMQAALMSLGNQIQDAQNHYLRLCEIRDMMRLALSDVSPKPTPINGEEKKGA